VPAGLPRLPLQFLQRRFLDGNGGDDGDDGGDDDGGGGCRGGGIDRAEGAEDADALSRLRLELLAGSSVVCIEGCAGAGKSTLAASVVRDGYVLQGFEAAAFVQVGPRPNLLALQRSIAAQLLGPAGVASLAADASSPEARLALLAAQVRGRSLLLVLDHVPSRPLLKALNVTDPGSASRLLVTTRARDLLTNEMAKTFHLGALPRAEAALLFARLAGAPVPTPVPGGGVVRAAGATAGGLSKALDGVLDTWPKLHRIVEIAERLPFGVELMARLVMCYVEPDAARAHANAKAKARVGNADADGGGGGGGGGLPAGDDDDKGGRGGGGGIGDNGSGPAAVGGGAAAVGAVGAVSAAIERVSSATGGGGGGGGGRGGNPGGGTVTWARGGSAALNGSTTLSGSLARQPSWSAAVCHAVVHASVDALVSAENGSAMAELLQLAALFPPCRGPVPVQVFERLAPRLLRSAAFEAGAAASESERLQVLHGLFFGLSQRSLLVAHPPRSRGAGVGAGMGSGVGVDTGEGEGEDEGGVSLPPLVREAVLAALGGGRFREMQRRLVGVALAPPARPPGGWRLLFGGALGQGEPHLPPQPLAKVEVDEGGWPGEGGGGGGDSLALNWYLQCELGYHLDAAWPPAAPAPGFEPEFEPLAGEEVPPVLSSVSNGDVGGACGERREALFGLLSHPDALVSVSAAGLLGSAALADAAAALVQAGEQLQAAALWSLLIDIATNRDDMPAAQAYLARFSKALEGQDGEEASRMRIKARYKVGYMVGLDSVEASGKGHSGAKEGLEAAKHSMRLFEQAREAGSDTAAVAYLRNALAALQSTGDAASLSKEAADLKRRVHYQLAFMANC
jgi:hypothetical protein